ncbi:MAG: 50S ribosomal protein L17 [Spirochaetales bacterium]|nr:50S ribosomal protein L17 [Spirochaetales bacterium]
MRHRVGYNRLSRKTSHRKAMLRNMVTSLFDYERITTTKAKALEVRKKAEKMITRAREDSVHNRRMAARVLYNKAVIAKLFTDIAPRFEKRPGGYTRILKTGYRKGDAAEMVILELVERKTDSGKGKKKKKAEKAAPAAESKTGAKATEPVKAQTKTAEKKAAPKKEAKPVEKKTAAAKETKAAEKKETKPAAKKAEPKEKPNAEKKTEDKKVEEKKEAAEKAAPEADEKTIAREKSNETGVVETAQQTIIEGE